MSECKPQTFTPWLIVFPRFKFTDTFAFGAPKVIGHFVTLWMIKYADMVIVSGMKSHHCIGSLLYSSDIGRHTSVLFINVREEIPKPEEGEETKPKKAGGTGSQRVRKANPKKAEGTGSQEAEETKPKPKVFVARYAWEHKEQRPNTHTFPLSCPVCHAIQPWSKPGPRWNEKGEGFTLMCGTKTDGLECPGKIKIVARPPSAPLKSPYVGQWYSYNPN